MENKGKLILTVLDIFLTRDREQLVRSSPPAWRFDVSQKPHTAKSYIFSKLHTRPRGFYVGVGVVGRIRLEYKLNKCY